MFRFGRDGKIRYDTGNKRKGKPEMKKIIALLLALVMALGCVGAFAEEASQPAFTMSFESKVNVEAISQLLPMLGVDESAAAALQAILPLLAETNGQIVIADNGAQFDLGLKGQTVLTVAGEMTESGIALASDILPSYVITLAKETVEKMLQQFTAQSEDAMANVDMNAVVESLTGYFMQFASAVTTAVSNGEPEVGEFVFEDLDLTFNCRMPIEIDLEAIKTAALTLVDQIKNDENFASLVSALGTMGIPVEISENTEVVTPEVTVYAYTNVDEEGNNTGEVNMVTVEVASEGQTVNVTVLMEGQNVIVYVEMPEQNMGVTVRVEPNDNGVFVSCAMNAAGVEAAETLTVTMGEAIQLHSETYLFDMENPIATDLVTLARSGERDFTVLDENKAEITVEQLMADTEGEIAGALLGDVMSNGLGALLAKVSEIMPDEVAALMTLLSGGQAAE